MKKIFGLLLGVIAVVLGTANAASADCLTVKFDNGDSVCIALDKNGSRYTASLEASNIDRNSSLRCEILLPNDRLEDLGACNGYFSYSSSSTEKVKLYVRYDNRYYTVKENNFNFKNGSWGGSSSSSSSSNDDISISSNRSSPSTSQWVNLTVETDSSYRGYVEFSVQYISSSSSSWSTVTSSSYFTADDEISDGYKFTSSDKGSVTFSSAIKFNRSGYYRLYVEDDDGNKDYVSFNVDTSSSGTSDDISISSNRSSPSTSQWSTITIETDSSYRGYVEFSVQYRSSSSSSWSTVTSSSYFTASPSSTFTNGYKFTSSDRGSVTLSSFIKFNRSGYYRLYVEDDDGNEDYVSFNVDISSSSTSDDISISSNRSSPSISQWNNVTVETDSSYRGYVEFSVQYRSSSSSSWSTVTSSSYFTADDEISDGYKFTSSDKGSVTFSSAIKFNRSGYYRLYVEDDDGNEDYVSFNVDTSSSSTSDDISISSNRSSPSTSQWVNLTVETDSSYRGDIEFTIKYKDGSTWRTTTSSSYYETNDSYDSKYYNYIRNGYTMSSSDRGSVEFKNILRFKKNLTYRVYVEDKDGNEDYVQFNVGGSSSNDDNDSDVDGFSTSELKKVKAVAKVWNDVVSQLKRQSIKLRNDTYWSTLSANFYTNMQDVVNDRSSRKFSDFDEFKDAFLVWLQYTSRNR